MLKDRRGSRRAFTVETKGGGRGRTTIPSRAVETEPSQPSVPWPAPDEPAGPPVEPRRILPSLIETEPAEVEAAVETPGPRRRGRSRKAPAVAAETVAAPTAPVAPAEASQLATASPRPASRPTKRWTALPPGQRWKHRLPRWSR